MKPGNRAVAKARRRAVRQARRTMTPAVRPVVEGRVKAPLIGEKERSAIREVVTFAQEPVNWIRDEGGVSTPSILQRRVVMLPQQVPLLQCIFTFLVTGGDVYRALSLKILAPGGTWPLSSTTAVGVAAWIAKAFGFTGHRAYDRALPDDWHARPAASSLTLMQFVQKDPS